MISKTKFVLLLLLLVNSAISQNGGITGKVIDKKTGESLPGATILIQGTTQGGVTDLDGKYFIKNIAPGTYTLECKMMSYSSQLVKGIIIQAGVTYDQNFILEEAATEVTGVVIEVKVSKESTASLMIEQKNRATVSDGIDAQTIKKTPDKSTSDVIKRVSGASIQDNKFAIIRGMNDRYNTAFINGSPLPSSESDRRAFAFDIFPSNLLDNLIIVKTATPDLPGDFAGGVIQINTKSIPDQNGQSISLSAAGNSITTGKRFISYEGGTTDWLGLDDGTRSLHGDLPGTEEYNKTTNDQKAIYAKYAVYDWSTKAATALPGFSGQYTIARRGSVFKKSAGFLLGITHNTSNNASIVYRREFEEQQDKVDKTRDYTDSVFSTTTLSSALLNGAFEINESNRISSKNLLSINSDNKTTLRYGVNDLASEKWEKSSVRWFTQNVIYSSQLSGEHLLPTSKIKINWNGGYSIIERKIPNMRKMVYNKFASDPNDSTPYSAQIQATNVTTGSAGTMFFSINKEELSSAKADASIPFEIKKSKHEIKVGTFLQKRKRDFSARLLGFTQYKKGTSTKFNTDLLTLSENQIFAPGNMGVMDVPAPYKGGFKLTEATTPLDSYNAYSELYAGYGMVDSRLNDKFRLIYGARVESYKQSVTNYNIITGDPIAKDTVVTDVLPSANFIWSLTDKINIRLAYSQTVSRPEFRELADFNFYDFITDFSVSGNSKLQRALINNYDARFEYFPDGGQMISASVFHKDITNAIEQIANTASQLRSVTYTNVPKVKNTGVELEYRVRLGRLFGNDTSVILNNFSIFSNLAFIKSTVDVSNVVGASERPLQGQSPVIINGGASYIDNEKGFSISASYNFIGKRIFIVGSVDEPDYWENPRHVIDLQLSKTFFKRLDVKLNIKDILAQNVVFYQDINGNKQLDKNSEQSNFAISHDKTTDNIMSLTKIATTYGLSVSFKF